ncbi:hypothetical protein VPH35_130651 [Triticum aestivum]
MPRVGDPALRPEEAHVVITSMPAMEDSAATLSNLGAVVWLGGNRPCVDATEIRNAIATKFVINRNYIKVVLHFPEDFFVLFTFQHHRDLLTASPGRFGYDGLDIHAAKWRLEAHADSVEAYYHVHLCIENLPLNAWCDEVATQVLRLTVTGNQPAGYSSGPSAAVGRSALKRRVLVHLTMVKDFTPGANGDVPSRPRSSHPLTWRKGYIDGESRMRDNSEMAGRRRDEDHDRDHDRTDDDRDRGRRGREDRPSSWRERVFRSRSRAPERRDDDNRRDHRGGHHDDRDDRRGGGHDERRRGLGAATPDARSIDLRRVQRLPDGSVLPAFGLRGRRRPADCVSRVGHPGAAASPVTEETRGRSPPPSPRTTSRDIVVVGSSPADASWLRWVAPCFGLKARQASIRPASPETQLASPRSLGSNVIETKKRAMPVAQMAERLLCQRMGIIDEGQQVTEEAIGKFVAMFQGRLPDITISALRALFDLDCDLA